MTEGSQGDCGSLGGVEVRSNPGGEVQGKLSKGDDTQLGSNQLTFPLTLPSTTSRPALDFPIFSPPVFIHLMPWGSHVQRQQSTTAQWE